MKSFVSQALAFILLSLFSSLALARDSDGYFGYELHQRGDPDSTVYETDETDTTGGVTLPEEPDVYLNANVSVGLISIDVENVTAKVNLNAKVLSLLNFNAGVDASINRVSLTIQNVSAKVLLEARLGNVVQMVGDVLNVIDLNPIVATLGNDVSEVVGNVTSALSGSSSTATSALSSATSALSRRSSSSGSGSGYYPSHGPLDLNLRENILYSINNYAGQKHTNRVLGQNGTLFDVSLDNDGGELGRRAVGYYSRDMTFTGHNRSITIDGETEFELGYRYAPYPGLQATSLVYVTPAGKVVKTKVIAEAEGGGTSTISDDDDL
ncbi:hypothetical protein GGR56DRAFT_671817 [Xylariaceae sp. FL0804]|nr:hypothetical protein GGR56DRAFT_671817 [Xylariaceae sp. FL0804]